MLQCRDLHALEVLVHDHAASTHDRIASTQSSVTKGKTANSNSSIKFKHTESKVIYIWNHNQSPPLILKRRQELHTVVAMSHPGPLSTEALHPRPPSECLSYKSRRNHRIASHHIKARPVSGCL